MEYETIDKNEIEKDNNNGSNGNSNEKKYLTKKELANEIKNAKQIGRIERKTEEKRKKKRLTELLRDLDNIMYVTVKKKYIDENDVQKRIIENSRKLKKSFVEVIQLNKGPINLVIQEIVNLIGDRRRSDILENIIFNRIHDISNYRIKKEFEKEFYKKYGLRCLIYLSGDYNRIEINIIIDEEKSGCTIS